MTDEERGLGRLRELYRQGIGYERMSRDPVIRETLLAGKEKGHAWIIWRICGELIDKGELPHRDACGKALLQNAPEPAPEDYQQRSLAEWEQMIGASRKRAEMRSFDLAGRQVIVGLPDPHIPLQRMDVITEIMQRHEGAAAVWMGDLLDHEKYSKYDARAVNLPTLPQVFAQADALLDLGSKYFSHQWVMQGNHDNRLWLNAVRKIGADYGWLCQRAIKQFYAARHGVEVVENIYTRNDGSEVDGLFFYLQTGDVIWSHAERCGKAVARGVSEAGRFYHEWKELLGLREFKAVVQAHTHKRAYTWDATIKAHLWEAGCLCDVPRYALDTQKYSPPQLGYFLATLVDGQLDPNQSGIRFPDQY